MILLTRGTGLFVQVKLQAGGAAGWANIWVLRLILRFFFWFKKPFEFRIESGDVSLYQNSTQLSSHAIHTPVEFLLEIMWSVTWCLESGLGFTSSVHVLDGFNPSALQP